MRQGHQQKKASNNATATKRSFEIERYHQLAEANQKLMDQVDEELRQLKRRFHQIEQTASALHQFVQSKTVTLQPKFQPRDPFVIPVTTSMHHCFLPPKSDDELEIEDVLKKFPSIYDHKHLVWTKHMNSWLKTILTLYCPREMASTVEREDEGYSSDMKINKLEKLASNKKRRMPQRNNISSTVEKEVEEEEEEEDRLNLEESSSWEFIAATMRELFPVYRYRTNGLSGYPLFITGSCCYQHWFHSLKPHLRSRTGNMKLLHDGAHWAAKWDALMAQELQKLKRRPCAKFFRRLCSTILCERSVLAIVRRYQCFFNTEHCGGGFTVVAGDNLVPNRRESMRGFSVRPDLKSSRRPQAAIFNKDGESSESEGKDEDVSKDCWTDEENKVLLKLDRKFQHHGKLVRDYFQVYQRDPTRSIQQNLDSPRRTHLFFRPRFGIFDHLSVLRGSCQPRMQSEFGLVDDIMLALLLRILGNDLGAVNACFYNERYAQYTFRNYCENVIKNIDAYHPITKSAEENAGAEGAANNRKNGRGRKRTVLHSLAEVRQHRQVHFPPGNDALVKVGSTLRFSGATTAEKVFTFDEVPPATATSVADPNEDEE